MSRKQKPKGGFLTMSFLYTDKVRADWVDYNGHMNDAEYARVFSLSVEAFMDFIGLDAAGREKHQYTIFTLETHLCYLLEASEGEALQVTAQLLDVDEKRMHLFFTLANKEGELVATSEQMLMGMDTTENRPASFPSPVQTVIDDIWANDETKETPKQAGRTIGIRRK